MGVVTEEAAASRVVRYWGRWNGGLWVTYSRLRVAERGSHRALRGFHLDGGVVVSGAFGSGRWVAVVPIVHCTLAVRWQ